MVRDEWAGGRVYWLNITKAPEGGERAVMGLGWLGGRQYAD